MNSRKSYILLVILIAGLIGLYLYNKYRVVPGVDMNKLVLTDNTGKAFSFAATKGTRRIVCFYGSWCGDCVKELKSLNAIKDKELGDVQVFAITDEPMEKLQAFQNKKQYPFTFLKLGQAFPDIGVHSIPVVYVFNAHDAIVYEHVGYINWEDPSTLHHIQTLLAE